MEEAQLKREIKMALENCACLGRDAYGKYITNLTEGLMNSVKKLNIKSESDGEPISYFKEP